MRVLLAALTVAALLVSGAAKADKRVAFVAGNGAYRNAVQLRTPPMDAKAMAATLRKVGFDVVEGADLTDVQMTERLVEFGKKAEGADIAVFFFAGHSIPVAGTNYLLPVDANIKSEKNVDGGHAINLTLTLDRTMNDAKIRLVFLDACRENPFAGNIRASGPTRSYTVQSGLAEMKTTEGSLIAFATLPDEVAPDRPEDTESPFARALIDTITQPAVDIEQAMRMVQVKVGEETHKDQLPWVRTNLIAPLYLDPAPASSAVAAPSPAAGAAPAAR